MRTPKLYSGSDLLSFPAHVIEAEPRLSPDGTKALSMLKMFSRLGIVPPMAGGARGFNQLGDVITQTVDGIPTNDLWAEFQRTMALRNANRQPLINFLTYSVASPVERIAQALGSGDFERASEFGVPVSVRPKATSFNMGFDFEWYDTATRFTWKFLAEAPAEEIRAINAAILEMDNRLVFSEVMRTLFRNTNRTATIDGNPYTVYTAYNNDGTVPPEYKTNVFAGTHNHYFTSGGATMDSGDLDDLIGQLTHHGYTQAEGANVVVMLNEAQGDVVRQFRSIANGGTAKYDFIPATNQPAFLLPTDVRPEGAVRPAGTLRGMTVIGTYGEATIVQENYIPAGYLVAFATGGPGSPGNPVGIREHARPELRGLRLVQARQGGYPLQDAYYQRGFGTGVRHRGALAVLQITASATYTVPAQYV
jgi:hypothetical protein